MGSSLLKRLQVLLRFEMASLRFFLLLSLSAHTVFGGCSSPNKCGQGEGDCDNNSDCVDGLWCDYDGWWDTDYCKAGSETVNAAWGSWSEWSECSVSCGGDGTQDRSWSCVAPVKGGFPCSSLSGADSQTQSCNNGPCPVNGGWGEFGAWDECPVSCGGAEHSRYRTCDNPAPAHGGEDCSGSNTETERCNENPCPINGAFSAWDDWTPCTAQCGGGDQTRTRRCDSPAPQHGGEDCVGELTECQRCNTDLCPSTCPA